MTEGAPPPAPASRRSAHACPICEKPATEAAYPFCSRRCSKIDLNRWLSDRYVIPAADEPPPGEGGEE